MIAWAYIVHDWSKESKGDFKISDWATGNEDGAFSEMQDTQQVRGGRIFSKVGFVNVKMWESYHPSIQMEMLNRLLYMRTILVQF